MSLTIGKLAKQSGVTIETIRYYQRKGLLVEPDKPLSGYRLYSQDAVSRIHFIKRAQKSGFTLKEVSELLSLDNGHCEDVRKMAEQKRDQVAHQIKDLSMLLHALNELVADCKSGSTVNQCALIDAFSGLK
ncbi:MAG: MerR family transcriptional regulator [Gammaproteobacteria bacterium]|nr:MAG: MerR family transcriptional regulator [Gammaproteobacteria bacterium]